MNFLTDPRTHQAVRRSTTATSILDVAAWIGMFASMLFWGNFFLTLIAPTGLVDLALALALAAGYAVVLPMLISLLAPSTPAGMALAETRWRTIGHGVAVGATLYMLWHAFWSVWGWLGSRPLVVQTEQDLFLAIGVLIIFVVVPALSWVQIAPDRWVAEVAQAQHVNRLRAAQQANLMLIREQYARALAIVKRGLANATAEERAELAGTLIALQRAENEALAQIADQLRIVTGIDTGVRLLDDPVVEQQFHELTERIERLPARINEADYVQLPPINAAEYVERAVEGASAPALSQPSTTSAGAHQNASERDASPTTANTTVTHGASPRATVRHGTARATSEHAAFLATAREVLGRTWTMKQLAAALSVSESQAREFAASWVEAGLVDRTRLRGFYTFVAQEG